MAEANNYKQNDASRLTHRTDSINNCNDRRSPPLVGYPPFLVPHWVWIGLGWSSLAARFSRIYCLQLSQNFVHVTSHLITESCPMQSTCCV